MIRVSSAANVQPAVVIASRSARAKSMVYDGTHWTVTEWNRADASPVISAPTTETKALLTFLHNWNAGQFVGSQVKWGDVVLGPPMINALSGADPVLYGYSLENVRASVTSQDWNGANRAAVKADMEAKYAAGKIIAAEDHMPNFLTGGNYADRTNRCMREIAPGGAKHADFKTYLDGMIGFLDSLSSGGKKVPVLLRLFHEVKLAAFWWSNYDDDGTGQPWVSDAEYKTVFQYTIDYLRSRLTNVLIVFNVGMANGGSFPSAGREPAFYTGPYPGGIYCDLITCDAYANGANPFPGQFNHGWLTAAYDAVADLAAREGKPFALSEVGFQYSAQQWGNNGEVGAFWDGVFVTQLRSRPRQPVFFMHWHGVWAPATATPPAASATAMYADKLIQLNGDIAAGEIYG